MHTIARLCCRPTVPKQSQSAPHKQFSSVAMPDPWRCSIMQPAPLRWNSHYPCHTTEPMDLLLLPHQTCGIAVSCNQSHWCHSAARPITQNEGTAAKTKDVDTAPLWKIVMIHATWAISFGSVATMADRWHCHHATIFIDIVHSIFDFSHLCE